MSTVWLEGETDHYSLNGANGYGTNWPILICLLGHFHILKNNQPVILRSERAGTLLRYLGLWHKQAVPRELLMEALWPGHTPSLASQLLNSLMYSLRNSLGGESHDDAPVIHEDGYYRLNKDAGVGIDIACLEELVKNGDQSLRGGDALVTVSYYRQACQLYKGDVYGGADLNAVMERGACASIFLLYWRVWQTTTFR